MIRPATPADTQALIAVSGSTGLFPPEELAVVAKLFDDYHSTQAASGHLALVDDDDGSVVGVAYALPREMTDRTWELLMIMVDATRQGRGVGSRLVRAVEEAIRAKDGRLLLAETAAVPEFEPTHHFYRKQGFAAVATVPDYYAAGVGKMSFTKLL